MDDVIDRVVERVHCYNKQFKEKIKINIPFKEETVTPLSDACYYCKEELSDNCVRDHDHLNGIFRGYAYNKCTLQAKKTIVPMYAYNSSNYDNHL